MIVYYILYLLIFLGVTYLLGEAIKWFLRDMPPMEPPQKDASESDAHYTAIYNRMHEGRK